MVETLPLIKDVLKDVEPSAKSRRQTIVEEFSESLSPIWVDEDMARRVLINLVENSSKYSPSKGTITVGAQAEDGWMHFWIKDQGSGIPASEKEHIFDKFTRLRGQSKAGGLGIGLAFCRLAVQGHGGRIWVDSEIGQGATFHFTFPIATDEQITGS
jgi:signal transduction histidine kinase